MLFQHRFTCKDYSRKIQSIVFSEDSELHLKTDLKIFSINFASCRFNTIHTVNMSVCDGMITLSMQTCTIYKNLISFHRILMEILRLGKQQVIPKGTKYHYNQDASLCIKLDL